MTQKQEQCADHCCVTQRLFLFATCCAMLFKGCSFEQCDNGCDVAHLKIIIKRMLQPSSSQDGYVVGRSLVPHN